MFWIESHQSLRTHRKTGRLARTLDISKVTAVGHLHHFWWWCMDNAPAGDLSAIDAEDIADGAGWEGDPHGFVEALIIAGFCDRDSDGRQLCVHGWADYAGKLIEKRRADAARNRDKRLADKQSSPTAPVRRTSNGHPSDVAGTVPNLTVPNRTGPEGDTPLPPIAPDGASVAIKKANRRIRKIAAEAEPCPTVEDLVSRLTPWAKRRGLLDDLELHVERFVNYCEAGRGGERIVYADYARGCQNWLTSPYNQNPATTAGRGRYTKPTNDDTGEEAKRILRGWYAKPTNADTDEEAIRILRGDTESAQTPVDVIDAKFETIVKKAR